MLTRHLCATTPSARRPALRPRCATEHPSEDPTPRKPARRSMRQALLGTSGVATAAGVELVAMCKTQAALGPWLPVGLPALALAAGKLAPAGPARQVAMLGVAAGEIWIYGEAAQTALAAALLSVQLVRWGVVLQVRAQMGLQRSDDRSAPR